MSEIKYLRNGEDDPIFIEFNVREYNVEIGIDVKNEEERKEVIAGLPTKVFFGKEYLREYLRDIEWDYLEEDCMETFLECMTNKISDETGGLIEDLVSCFPKPNYLIETEALKLLLIE